MQVTDNEIVHATILRYDPGLDKEPHYETFEVPYEPYMRVLDVLERIVEDQGVSLAYRWFCGVKKCGSCGMMVNGRPVLACWEPAQREMVIEPLPNYTVIRDLVVDRKEYDTRATIMEPVLQRDKPYPGFPEPLTSSEMVGAAEMMDCIECLLCTSVCPSYSDTFAGPAALVQLAKVALDPRDGGARAQMSNDLGNIAECVSCYQCTQSCPTNINVLEHAIDGLRRQIVQQDIGEVAHHHHVFRGLTIHQGLVNPVTLMLQSKGWRIIFELPHALRLLHSGRLSLRSLWKGLLKPERMRDAEEIEQIASILAEQRS